MQLRLSPVIRLVGFALSLLAVSYSIYHLLEIKKNSEEKVIHCLSAFESRVNDSRLQAKVTLYLYREKGSVQISGYYSSPAGVQTPVKSVSGIVYPEYDYFGLHDGCDIYINKRGQPGLDNELLLKMLPGITSGCKSLPLRYVTPYRNHFSVFYLSCDSKDKADRICNSGYLQLSD
ncbi:hypothetical protein [Klebsiella quasipneumoniae]|uniref:hypothetical protein n=1 Tax=Klebsiella quasipneumoniae TaxID=1463165 RepID=UPI0021FA0E22|nr:hypothetical protein [Klebsiella quasipneumoniae]BDO04520.1 hypothetical protein KAM622c_41070 [Klebsiella quasipneumoniae subsp. quasipneumoniae]